MQKKAGLDTKQQLQGSQKFDYKKIINLAFATKRAGYFSNQGYKICRFKILFSVFKATLNIITIEEIVQ